MKKQENKLRFERSGNLYFPKDETTALIISFSNGRTCLDSDELISLYLAGYRIDAEGFVDNIIIDGYRVEVMKGGC